MSDTEESFESADEGENSEQIKSTAKQKKRTHKEGSAKTADKGEGHKNETQQKQSDGAGSAFPDQSMQKNSDEEKVSADVNLTESGSSSTEMAEVKISPSSSESDSIVGDDKNKEDNVTTQPEKISEKLGPDGPEKSNNGGWGWGGWGSTLLETATSSVVTFTDAVGDGLNSVIETVESTLGAPDPDELAEQTRDSDRLKLDEKDSDTNSEKTSSEEVVDLKEGPTRQDIARDSDGSVDPKVVIVEDNSEKDSGWFSTLGMASITKTVKNTVQQTSSLVQEKGKGFVHGGLDVLETIGKKTYDALAEGDHGIKKTIEKAKEKPVLSQLLREAAEEAEEAAKQEEEFVESRKSHFGAQFDDFQGLVQLEALEMLSNQCESKVQSLLSAMTADEVSKIKRQLVAIKDCFELADLDEDDEEEHAFIDLVTDYTGKLALNLTAVKLTQVHEKQRKCISDIEKEEKTDDEQLKTKDIHQKSIQSLAELTARTVEHFHRMGQLLLIDPKGPVTGYKDKATAIASLTKVICCEVGIMCSKFTQCLHKVTDKNSDKESVNPLITNVFLEADNSSKYIQDAFQLLLPVVQQAAIQTNET